jgi:5-formyltetrahydrofolate cyclo-ligase
VASRAPDITERPIIDLSGRTSAYYDPTGNKFDIAIGSMPFIFGITDNTPYRRQTAEFRTARVDQGRDPGEQSLSGSGYWIRSQSSFHLGAGIDFAESLAGNDEEIKFRYKSSIGLDPWTPGELKLLKKTELQEGSASRSGVFSTKINNEDFLIKVTGAATETIRVLKIATNGTETTVLNNTDITETILWGCMGGNDLMLVTPTKVLRYSFDAATPALHQDYHINTANAASAHIAYVKQRFILAYTDVNKNTFVYELARNTGSHINLSTLTAVNGSTTLPINFQFTGVTESSNAIYVGGYSGDEGSAFKITVDDTGALSTMTRVVLLPRSEILTGLYGYLGSYIMIGTNRGVRVAIVDSNGNVSYGPLVFESNENIYAFTAANQYVWCGVKQFIGGLSGLVRINLGAPLANGSYAYATDLVAGTTTTSVWSVATFNNGRKAFTVEGSGLWIESATDLVDSGEFTTAKIRFDTLENKAWKRLRLRTHTPLNGSVDMLRTALDSDTDIALQSIDEGTTTNYDYDLAKVFPDVSVEAAFKLRLNRNTTTASTGAVLYGYSVKALPTPTRARVIQIPLLCFDKETDKLGNILGYDGYARERLAELERVEADGKTIIIQDFTAGGEPIEAVIEQITFNRTTPPKSGYTGFGGIVQVIARTVI